MTRSRTVRGESRKRHVGGRFAGLGLALLIGSLCPLASSSLLRAEERRSVAFETHEIEIGMSGRPSVLTGDFVSDGISEIAFVGRDASGVSNLTIYALGDEGWRTRSEAVLRPDVVFVDVAAIAGRDRIITVGGDRITWFDPDSATERPMVPISTDLEFDRAAQRYADAEPMGPSHDSEIPLIDITRDLNRDGRDDLLLPDRDGFWVSIQQSDGTFAEPMHLGPPEPFLDERGLNEQRTYGDVGLTAVTIPWYLSRAHQMDHDLDGLTDLVFWDGDRFLVHRQEGGGFSPTATEVTTDVEFASDGAYSLLFGFSGQSSVALLTGLREKSEHTVLHSLADMNDDDVADLVTLTISGRSLVKQRSRYDVHLGSATPAGVVFDREAAVTLRARGRAAGLQHSGYSLQWAEDLDADGRIEIIRRDVRIGAGGMIRALLGKSVALDVEVHRILDGDKPEAVMTSRRIRPDLRPFGSKGDIFFPPLLLGDVDGDGLHDLVVGENRERFHLFFGTPGPEAFSDEPQELSVLIPADERNTWLTDLDDDGRQDLLLHQKPTDRMPDLPHRLTVLLAR